MAGKFGGGEGKFGEFGKSLAIRQTKTFGRSIHSPNFFCQSLCPSTFTKHYCYKIFPLYGICDDNTYAHYKLLSPGIWVYGQRNVLYYIYIFIIIAITIASIGYYFDYRSEGSSRLSVDDIM